EAMAVFDADLQKHQAGNDHNNAPRDQSGGSGTKGTNPDTAAAGAGTSASASPAGGGTTRQGPSGVASGTPTAGAGGNASADHGTGQSGYGGEADTGGAGGNARTDAERRAALDRKLNKELAVFDGIILNRRADVINQENKEGGGNGRDDGTGGGGSGGNAAQGGSGDTPPLLTANAKDTGNVITRGQVPNAPADNRKGDYKQANAKPHDDRIPPDIPSGDDDDIVARQLREAAMKEDDPKLRAKLWDEYRKYKAGVQAKR
ncbi:MAG: hypothetical protein P8126_00085, partial [Gammaproteobacteria bacterium]